MTLVLFQRVDGKPMASPVELPRGRRRLSTIVRARADRSRPHIVSVHRKNQPLAVTDFSVRLRKDWRNTTVGPNDTVIIIYPPLGGGGAAGGNRAGKAASIGLLVATVALAAIGQFWAIGAIGNALNVGAKVAGAIWAAGSAVMLAGGAYLLSKATQAKANKDEDNRPVYGVSGGGNLPRAGDRIPIVYGRCWNSPDLSQPDYTVYDGDDQVLYKRLTVGLGNYAIKKIRVGTATMWTDTGGVQAPFTGAEVQVISPGGTSTLVPGQVVSAAAVTGNEVQRASDNPQFTGPFDFGADSPLQSRIQIDFSLPQGVYSIAKQGKYEGKQFPTGWAVRFQYAPCDLDGNPTGPWTTLLEESQGTVMVTRAIRRSRFIDIPPGRYTFRAQNLGGPAEVTGADVVNAVVWEGLRSHLPETIVRPAVTEIAMKIRSGKGLGVTAFGNVEVESSKILPVWNGTAWVEQETAKCVWAAADILRNPIHGAGLDDAAIDIARLRHYATTLAEFDTFSGVIRGPVSVYEALTTVLGPMRASPLRLSNVWSMVRDEQAAVRKHVISRRQIIKDSTGQTFNLDLSDGSADIIVEWLAEGDPKRRREQRVTFGTVTNVPRRMMATGVTTARHAISIATWAAASAYFRRERRSVTTELAGRLLLPNDKVSIDAWYFDAKQAAGVIERSGNSLAIDTELTLPANAYALLRARDSKEWGPVAVTQPTPGVLALNAADVAAAQAASGLTLAQVINTDTQAPTTVMLGTLSEVRDSWLVRSVGFTGETRVNVEAVYDAPEVWTALGEVVPEPPDPPSREFDITTTITVGYIRAKAVQRSGANTMDWSVGRSRLPCDYVVRLSYDNWATFEEVYRGPASSGSYALRDFVGIVSARAYAVSSAGIVSPTVQTQFTTSKVIITGDNVDLRVDVDNLITEFRSVVDWSPLLQPETLAALWNVTMTAASADGKASASIKRIEQVNADQTQARALLAERLEANFGANNASITEVKEALATTNGVVATHTTQIAANTTGISGLTGNLSTLSSTVGLQGLAITDLATNKADATSVLAVNAKVDSVSAGGQFSITATAGPGGASSRMKMRVAATAGGTMVDAGIMIDADTGSGTQIALIASKLVFVDNSLANPFQAFAYVGGQWYLSGIVRIDGSLIVSGTVTATNIAANSLSISKNGSYAVDTHATGSPNTVVGVGGGTWSDYVSLAVTPANDARVEIKWEAENIVTTSGSGSIAVHEVRLVRRKGGDTQLGRTYTVSGGGGTAAVDRYFPTVRDEPGTGAVTYVIQHRMNSGSPGAGGYTGRCLYGSITLLVSEK